MKSTKHFFGEEMVQDKREKNVLAQIQEDPLGKVELLSSKSKMLYLTRPKIALFDWNTDLKAVCSVPVHLRLLRLTLLLLLFLPQCFECYSLP